MFGRTKKSDIDFAKKTRKVDIKLKRNHPHELNPLRQFPTSSNRSNHETLSTSIYGSNLAEVQRRKIEKKNHWLHPEEIRPDFGLKVSLYYK